MAHPDPAAVPSPLPDIQASGDSRGIPIDRVGICDLRYPIQVMDREGKLMPTVAMISMSVHLPHHFKGTHMSRFLEVLSKYEGEVTMRTLPDILHDLRQRLDAEEAHIEVGFAYFVTKQAPVSGACAKVGCECDFLVISNGKSDRFALRVTVPVTTLCPCSKEISNHGAHNQRGYVTMELRPRRHADDTWGLILMIQNFPESCESPINLHSCPAFPNRGSGRRGLWRGVLPLPQPCNRAMDKPACAPAELGDQPRVPAPRGTTG